VGARRSSRPLCREQAYRSQPVEVEGRGAECHPGQCLAEASPGDLRGSEFELGGLAFHPGSLSVAFLELGCLPIGASLLKKLFMGSDGNRSSPG
jgi:hypothetical protein